jgi:CP family cyanate transporter-like MFS transporter
MRLTRADWVRLLLLWLGGINLRVTILAVPPLVPLIHRDLHLDEKGIGALVSLPILLLAVATVPGSLLIAKLGLRGALLTGLGFIALFGALRGIGPSTPVLFGTTFLMGLGVAFGQPAFPSLVREWFPRKIAIATAAFSNGFLIGETLPTILTTPIGALPLARGDWRWAIGFWSVLVAATGIAIVMAAPKRVKLAAPARWWPDWRNGQIVRIGLVMGMASAAYFGTNAFIPDFLDQTRRHDLISPTLAVLNASQLLTSPAVALWPRFITGRFGFVSSSVLMGLGQLGLMLTPGPGVLVWAFFTGFGSALGFIVALSLPPRLAPAGDVHRMSAAMFTIQYTVAFVVPLIAGALWDVSGLALLAFVPGVIGAGLMAWLAMALRIPSTDMPPHQAT